MATAPNYNWSDGQKAAAKDFFTNAKSSDEIYGRANELGLDSNQLADLWSQSTGGDYNAGVAMTSDYLKNNNKAFSGGYVAPTANAVGGAPKNNGMLATVVPNNDLSVANKPYQPKFDWTGTQLGTAKSFFEANKNNSEELYRGAIANNMSAEQMADAYVRTMGGDYNSVLGNINAYIQQSGKTPLVNNTAQIAKTGDTGSNGTYGYNNTGDVAKANTVNWNVTPDQTMEGRMAGLLSQNNPLVQMAQTQGLEAAQQRGLLNSSLGAEAGALAHYQYASDIAKTDANTFASAARQNASENTNVNLQNANSLNTRSVLDTNQAYQKWQTEQSQNLAKWQTEFNANLSKSNLDQTQQFALKQAYAGAMDNIGTQYANMYNNIQMQNIDPAAKTSLLDNLDVWQANSIDLTGALYSRMSDIKAEFSALPPTE